MKKKRRLVLFLNVTRLNLVSCFDKQLVVSYVLNGSSCELAETRGQVINWHKYYCSIVLGVRSNVVVLFVLFCFQLQATVSFLSDCPS